MKRKRLVQLLLVELSFRFFGFALGLEAVILAAAMLDAIFTRTLLGRGTLAPLPDLIQVDDIAHVAFASPRCSVAGIMILYLWD